MEESEGAPLELAEFEAAKRDIGVLPKEQETGDDFFLPSIKVYPEKARLLIEPGCEKASELCALVSKEIKAVLRFYDAFARSRQQNEQHVREQSELSEQERREISNKLRRVDAEWVLLQRAHKRLSDGHDAYELLARKPSVGFYERFGYLPPEDDRRRFGASKNPIALARKAYAIIKNKRYRKEKQEYFNKLHNVFNQRLENFVEGALGIRTGEVRPYQPGRMLFDAIDLDALFSVTDLELETLVNKVSERFWTHAAEFSKRIQKRIEYMHQLQSWSTGNRALLASMNLLSPMKQTAMDLLQHDSALANDMFDQNKRLFEGNYTHTRTAYQQELLRKAAELLGPQLREIHSSFYKKDSGDVAPSYCWIPAESVREISALNREVERVLQLGKQFGHYFLGNFEMTYGSTANIEQGGQWVSKVNRELPGSRDLLWNVAPYWIVKAILERGVLASRAYQEQMFGESYFTSGGMIKKKDEIFDTFGYHRPMSVEEFKVKTAASSRKLPEQESHQVCFLENQPYMYLNGVALIFSKASLFSKAQFMDCDGLHLFNPAYKTRDTNAPGFHVDLTNEPFLLLAEESLKENLTTFIREHLPRAEAWQGKLENIEKWIADHVMFVPVLQRGYDEHGEPIVKNWEELIESTNTQFHQKFQVRISPSYFLPTGEKGETAVRSWEPLYTYKAAQDNTQANCIQ